ncbi:patatin-like phospholipase family protein [Chitinophaga horti]|uniref:Patatin-like phospholipase family protein n=1 Tax=Chitinophaga horti TaxID=2920382 RepID=A0ABY6J7X6_9BACT|nr:patatin-like phospholipase family protein [Chitinophaga horti]UYQ94394.1 patatin-like phospholipase family protein [Chitinophaga horti]
MRQIWLIWIYVIALLPMSADAQQVVQENSGAGMSGTGARRPRIGLALSGGGAKGLAHIGILEAIDSAGLKIDYIAGTSMGSIVGSLYAIGYPADSIEAMARRIDWTALFANQPPLTDISFEEKDEFNRYLIEVPFEHGKPKLTSGMITGEQLWLELAKLYYPVKDIKDFSCFNIPFKCIATDVATGEMVTLDSGELVSAVRASIAIPSVFTAVKIGDRKLVDGGVVRNFPTITAQDMGAEYIIGSNVSSGLRPAEELITPLDILYQLGFYKAAEDFGKARKITDLYIDHPGKKFTAASFNNAEAIIEEGKRRGREYYPVFKRLADSLNAIQEAPPVTGPRLPYAHDIELTTISVKGLKHSDENFFMGRLGLESGGCYRSEDLREAVMNVFGTRFYKQITYDLVPEGMGRYRMLMTVEETPLTYVKGSLHYNTYSDIAANINFTRRNFLIPNSRSFLTIGISESPRFKAEYFKYLGNKRNVGFGLNMHYEDNPLNIYSNFDREQVYRNKYFGAGALMQVMPTRNMSLGGGVRIENLRLKPKIANYIQMRGDVWQYNAHFNFGVNTLNRKMYPTSGMDVQLETGYIFGHRPDFAAYEDGRELPVDTLELSFSNYQRIVAKMNYYIPLGYRGALQLSVNGGVNFDYNQSLVNAYLLGGLNPFTRNNVPFVGIYEGEVISPSVVATQMGVQYEVYKNLFLTPVRRWPCTTSPMVPKLPVIII